MGMRFQARQIIKETVQNLVLPVCYFLFRLQKTDPDLVVFADAHHDGRPAAMDLLYRRLKKEGSWRIREHYLDYGKAGASAVAAHSIRFMQLYAKAGFVVICDNFLPAASCRKRAGTKLIQLWHACGCYKKFGYDAKDDIPENYHGANVYRNADLVTVSGRAAVRPFASAMRLPASVVRPVGVSRTDLYRSSAWAAKCRERFYERYPEAAGKKVALWAPTFRGNAGVPENITVDIGRLRRELGDSWLVLTKLHPHMLHQGSEAEDAADMGLCPIPTEELYPVTDVLIADYSSLVYEYLMFEKPLVLYCPDLEDYRKRRGFYMDITDIPGEIAEERSEEKLAEAVRRAHIDPEALSGFLAHYMGACDGHATERITKWMKENKRE